MGTTGSVSQNDTVTGKSVFNPSVASDDVKVCESCNIDSEKVADCRICQKTLCLACCQHLAETERKKNNPVYGEIPIPAALEAISNSTISKKIIYKKVRCGTFAQDGKIVLLSQCFFDDKFCDCCHETSEWKLCFLGDAKAISLTQRLHSDNTFVHPGDICYAEKKKKLYLTLPCKQTVYKWSSGNAFYCAFNTPLGSCFGITTFDGGFALSIRLATTFAISKWQIQFTDYSGNIKNRLQNSSDDKALFLEPLYLSSNKQENTLFVSDQEKHSVLAFDTGGNLMFEFTDPQLRSPLGISVDSVNNVYVACGKKVIQVEKDGGRCKQLLSVTSDESIVGVCIDQRTDSLTVISDWGNVSTFIFQCLKDKLT